MRAHARTAPHVRRLVLAVGVAGIIAAAAAGGCAGDRPPADDPRPVLLPPDEGVLRLAGTGAMEPPPLRA